MAFELKNDRLIKALLRKPVDMTPVWIMRQAGRYLPEYRAIRKEAGDFLKLCKTPELACEVTLQPIIRYPLDAAIIFSDILTIPDAMGLGLKLVESVGPKFENPISSLSDIKNLPLPDPEEELRYVMDAIRLVRKELDGNVPLIGFSGSPWTLATYMIEGGSSREFTKAKKMLREDPDTLHILLNHLSKSIILYLNAQIKAGAQTIMIFDTWGGALKTPDYMEFSLSYMKKIYDHLDVKISDVKIPVILFTKGSHLWIEDIVKTGCDAVSIDWNCNIGEIRKKVGSSVAIQGNMNPIILKESEEVITKEVQSILHSFGSHPGHVFNLGHGITPDIDPDNVEIFIRAVHHFSKKYHKN